MPRVRCPECERLLELPNDYRRPTVACPACGTRFDLAEPPRERRPRPPRDDEPRRKKKKPIRGFVPLLIFGPVCGVLAILTPFSVHAALGAILLGLPLMLVAIFRVYAIFKEMGRQHELDEAARGIGNWRGVAVMAVSIAYAFKKPRRLGAWVFLEFLGMVILIEGILAGVWGEERERHQRIEQDQQRALAERERQQNPGVNPEMTPAQVLDKALANLGSGDPGVVTAAANYLATLPPNERRAEVAAKLAGLVNMPDVFARRAVVRALGVWATPAEVPALLTALGGDDLDTKKGVLERIGAFHDERAAEPVARCLEDLMLADTAHKALSEMGPPAEDAVIPLLSSRNIPARRAAIEVLRDIGTKKSMPHLTAIVKSKDAFFAPIALQARKTIFARLKAEQKKKQDEDKQQGQPKQ